MWMRHLRWRRGPSARAARHHAIVLAVTVWTITLVSTFGGSGLRSLAGPLNAIDFVQFYTLGHLADSGQMMQAYDGVTFHAAQATLVPASAEYIYPPVYPPQTALLLIPFSRLSYGLASLVWTAITVALYAVIVWFTWRTVSDVLTDRMLVFFAAAAFPPFWYDVFHGQIAVVILAACWLAWVALGRGHRFLAGCALGLLAIKPQFGLPFVAIVLARREWAMLAGALACAVVQAALVWALLGASSLTGYASFMALVLPHADLLEAKPYLSHSLRALTRLLPTWLGVPVWVAIAGWVLWRTARAWRTDAPLDVRFGLVMLAAVLVNPHLIVYDATILVLPLLWFGASVQRTAGADARKYGALVYGLFVTLFVPTAAVIKVQLSVPLMVWLFREAAVRIDDDFSRLAEAPIAARPPAAAPRLSPSAARTAPR